MPGVTVVAVVVPPAPLPFGVSVTVTLAGKIVPLGNPEPVTDTVVTPACPVVGLVAEPSATLASFTVKPLATDAGRLPVSTATGRAPSDAEMLIAMLAVAVVELVTVTGPYAPIAAP